MELYYILILLMMLNFVFGLRQKDTGTFAICGASTTPAISAAVVADLTKGWQRVETVDVTILPSGAVSTGPSLMGAVLSYAGKPVATHDVSLLGRHRLGWRNLEWVHFPEGLGARFVSDVDTVDALLFPSLFNVAQRTRFRAGLESKIEQIGMSLLGWFHDSANLTALAPVLQRLRKLTALGCSSSSGMHVNVRGADENGAQAEAQWTLVVRNGHGLAVPTVPALVCLERPPAPGAYMCSSLVSLDAIESAFKSHPVLSSNARTSRRISVCTDDSASCFHRALGSFEGLPRAVRSFHAFNRPSSVWRGKCNVVAGSGIIARALQFIGGMPRESTRESADICVTVERNNGSELWTRSISGVARFSSLLSWDANRGFTERFTIGTFQLGLRTSNAGLEMPITRWWLFHRIPMPLWMAPHSDALSYQDADGRYSFRVNLTFVGLHIVQYQGYLEPCTKV